MRYIWDIFSFIQFLPSTIITRTKDLTLTISKEHTARDSLSAFSFKITLASSTRDSYQRTSLREVTRGKDGKEGPAAESEKVSSERNYRIFPATRRGQMRPMDRYSNNTASVVTWPPMRVCDGRDNVTNRLLRGLHERARAESVFLHILAHTHACACNALRTALLSHNTRQPVRRLKNKSEVIDKEREKGKRKK